eukprot:9482061-Pyramimonas_sp.AAC.1
MELEAQAFTVGVPDNPREPPGMLAPGQYGPCTALQTLMQMHAAHAEEYPDSQRSVESGHMMLQDSDVCDDSELVLAALTLIDSVLPDDVQRH